MTQVFNEDGVVIPVTVVEAGPLKVIQKKTVENDGYNAIQVGFKDKKENRINKPLKGHFDKAGIEYKKYIKEFIVDNVEEFEIGQEIKADIFQVGDKIDVVGTSKGRVLKGLLKDIIIQEDLKAMVPNIIEDQELEQLPPIQVEYLKVQRWWKNGK